MENTSQWEIALLIGIPIAAFFAWFNKSGSDFRNSFKRKTKKTEKMNYQCLPECYTSGLEMIKNELKMLEIELDTQIDCLTRKS